MLVLQINKGDADYFLEQILVDPIPPYMEQNLPEWAFHIPHGTGPTQLTHIAKGKIQDTLCCV
jgi:hypothetical protein